MIDIPNDWVKKERLTPEREQEIRRRPIAREDGLLAEIDALRADLKVRNETQITGYCIRCEEIASKFNEKCDQVSGLMKERDLFKKDFEQTYEECEELYIERDQLKAARIAYASEFDDNVEKIHENIRSLKAENERLHDRPYSVNCPACGCEYANEAGIALQEENQKLRERIAKLKEALEILRKNSASVLEGRISGEALAHDEMEKQG